MTNKILMLALGLAIFGASEARAGENITDVGYSSHAVTGVICTTGTVVQINASRPAGFSANVGGYRIQNQDSADTVWIGGPSVSTTSVSAAQLAVLGESIAAGGNAPYSLGKDYSISSVPLVKLYCRAADAAGAAGAVLSVVWFGY